MFTLVYFEHKLGHPKSLFRIKVYNAKEKKTKNMHRCSSIFKSFFFLGNFRVGVWKKKNIIISKKKVKRLINKSNSSHAKRNVQTVSVIYKGHSQTLNVTYKIYA